MPPSSAADPLLTSIPSTQLLHLLLLQLLRWHLLLRLLQGMMTTQRSRFFPCSRTFSSLLLQYAETDIETTALNNPFTSWQLDMC